MNVLRLLGVTQHSIDLDIIYNWKLPSEWVDRLFTGNAGSGRQCSSGQAQCQVVPLMDGSIKDTIVVLRYLKVSWPFTTMAPARDLVE